MLHSILLLGLGLFLVAPTLAGSALAETSVGNDADYNKATGISGALDETCLAKTSTTFTITASFELTKAWSFPSLAMQGADVSSSPPQSPPILSSSSSFPAGADAVITVAPVAPQTTTRSSLLKPKARFPAAPQHKCTARTTPPWLPEGQPLGDSRSSAQRRAVPVTLPVSSIAISPLGWE